MQNNYAEQTSCLKEFARYTSLNVLGMIGLSCYILADTFFVAKGLGTSGLAALNLAIPVYSFIHGSGLMFGIGGATKFSISRKSGLSDLIFTNTLFFAGITALLFFLAGLFLSPQITALLGADSQVAAMTQTYLKMILLFAPAFILNDILVCFVRNDGNPRLSMLAMLGGSMANILLDYVFIFPLGMGIFGAVLATGLAPLISIAIMSGHWMGKNKGFHLAKTEIQGQTALLILSLIQGGGELLLTRVNTTIACFLPACLSLVALILIGRMKMYRQEWSVEDSRIMDRGAASGTSEETPDGMTLVQAFVPYILLTVVTMVVLVVPPVNRFLNQVSIGFSFPETSTGYGFVNQATELFSPLRPFTHASMFLFLSSIAGLVYFGRHGWIRPGGVKRVFVRSITMSMPSGIAIIGLVIMSKIMGGTGQTSVLADGIARVLGKTYVILAPLVGMVGSFMTGSNMSSNILFGEFQVTTANLLHLNQAPILGAQTAGGSIGSAISPSNIILGTTTAGILGSEGQVLKRIIPFTTIMTLAIGIIVFLSVAVS